MRLVKIRHQRCPFETLLDIRPCCFSDLQGFMLTALLKQTCGAHVILTIQTHMTAQVSVLCTPIFITRLQQGMHCCSWSSSMFRQAAITHGFMALQTRHFRFRVRTHITSATSVFLLLGARHCLETLLYLIQSKIICETGQPFVCKRSPLTQRTYHRQGLLSSYLFEAFQAERMATVKQFGSRESLQANRTVQQGFDGRVGVIHLWQQTQVLEEVEYRWSVISTTTAPASPANEDMFLDAVSKYIIIHQPITISVTLREWPDVSNHWLLNYSFNSLSRFRTKITPKAPRYWQLMSRVVSLHKRQVMRK